MASGQASSGIATGSGVHDSEQRPPLGHIEVVCGPMFCGKSEELIRRLRRAAIARKHVLCVKPAIDDRDPRADIVSHAGSRLAARPIGEARDLLELCATTDVVGIDEAQFFGPSIVDVSCRLAADGIVVIVAGLDRDYRGRPFGSMPQLLCLADEVTKLHAVCVRCGRDASLTQRLLDGHPAPFDDATIVVGGPERYEARCRACFAAG
jgi:thymidine kinase